VADKLEQEETCAACGYVSKEVEQYNTACIAERAVKGWACLVMDVVNSSRSMYADNYSNRVIACPKCKTMRML
jgi:hypothetical protein